MQKEEVKQLRAGGTKSQRDDNQADEVDEGSENLDRDLEVEEDRDWCDTEPVLLGHDSNGTEYFYFDSHQDCRVYSRNAITNEFVLETNSPEELKFLITKLKQEDERAIQEIKQKHEEDKKKQEESQNKRRKTRQTAQSKNQSVKQKEETKIKNSNELIKELESLEPLFTTNHEEYHKRQTILARKMQTLERSRMLLTKQRTRRAEKELDATLLQGRVTRGRLKDFKKTVEDENNDKASVRSGTSASKDVSKIQYNLERQRRQEKVESERLAREQRRQKRLFRNEFLTTADNKEELKNINWSNREIIREFNRLRALRKKEMKSRKRRAGVKYAFRARKGSVNTEDESDLFENPEDFEWPEAEKVISHKQKSTASGRPVNKRDIDEDNEGNEGLKIMMEANVYRLLGVEEQGVEEMDIFLENEKYFKRTEIPELKDKIWIKGEWVLSGDNQRSKMEYRKQKDFSDEIHGRMISTLKDLIKKRDEEGDSKADENLESNQDEIAHDPVLEDPSSKDPEKDEAAGKFPSISSTTGGSPKHQKVFMIEKDFSHRSLNTGHELQ